jgi:4-amino-4-deoxychorismate lyase
MVEFALVDGVAANGLPLADRGFAYGDGVFETMRAIDGRVPLWPLHLARLAEGCRRLGMELPPASLLLAEIERALADAPAAVLKLVLTRGDGGRGYAPPRPSKIRRVLMRFPAPLPFAHESGLSLGWCSLQLPRDRLLAGIKHLNRLHQVLARAEVDQQGCDEGLCCDDHGQVVCATAANVFARIDGQLHTPDVSDCGVAGVARAALLQDPEFGSVIRVGALQRSELARAQEIFLSNAVRGVMPVRQIGERSLVVGESAAQARAALARCGFAPVGA